MSQDKGTSQIVTDLGEESAAGRDQVSTSGTDASAAGPIEEYNKSSIGTADNAKTTPTIAGGDFDEDADKIENAQLEAFLDSVTEFFSDIQESTEKLSSAAMESLTKLFDAAQASTRLSSSFRKARAETSIDLNKAVAEFFIVHHIARAEFSCAIQELKQFSSSFQEATPEILSTFQDAATAEFFSTVQESTVGFLIAAFEAGTEASHVVHVEAEVSSPFQERAPGASHVVQETGTENAAAEREVKDGSLSHTPDTGNSTLAISVPTVESPTECKSSPDSSQTALME